MPDEVYCKQCKRNTAATTWKQITHFGKPQNNLPQLNPLENLPQLNPLENLHQPNTLANLPQPNMPEIIPVSSFPLAPNLDTGHMTLVTCLIKIGVKDLLK